MWITTHENLCLQRQADELLKVLQTTEAAQQLIQSYHTLQHPAASDDNSLTGLDPGAQLDIHSFLVAMTCYSAHIQTHSALSHDDSASVPASDAASPALTSVAAASASASPTPPASCSPTSCDSSSLPQAETSDVPEVGLLVIPRDQAFIEQVVLACSLQCLKSDHNFLDPVFTYSLFWFAVRANFPDQDGDHEISEIGLQLQYIQAYLDMACELLLIHVHTQSIPCKQLSNMTSVVHAQHCFVIMNKLLSYVAHVHCCAHHAAVTTLRN